MTVKNEVKCFELYQKTEKKRNDSGFDFYVKRKAGG